MEPTNFSLEVKPRLPRELERLWDLANNLIYGWNQSVRALFCSLDRELWSACQHNPKLMLRRIDQEKLNNAARDEQYLREFHRLLHWYDDYCRTPRRLLKDGQASPELVAYFCAEYGLHESFPNYSGGLGILAGDHCKAASDMALPLVAVGLLYRQSHSSQTIDAQGQQAFKQVMENFDNLPVAAVVDAQGQEIQIDITIANREIALKIWQVKAGRVSLYLLDSDVAPNAQEDRRITARLYDSGQDTRILQEMVLGIGGVRALRALGLAPQVWHINEGHAAFLVIERIMERVRQGMGFHAALEQVAGATVFTLHTPIAAGHDIFNHETIVHFFSRYMHDVNIGFEDFLALGKTEDNPHVFSMTSLALRGSRFHNGVSRIHGDVASKMERHIWPQVPTEENPLGYITNGVHIETFLDKGWQELLNKKFPAWRDHLNDQEFWECLNEIDNAAWWRIHNALKQTLLRVVQSRLCYQHRRNGLSEALIERSCSLLNGNPKNVLVIGFARRFATYKRATLLFSERARLAHLLSDMERPLVILFAGKAHADDEPGKALIKSLYELSLQPEFVGKIVILEGYDMALARRMVAGCDIWLNTPRYPMEACGTSGQKAALNGVVNLSIKDGWWGEGYDGNNGWAVTPHGADSDIEYCDRQEAMDILDIIEHQVIPGYFERGKMSYPPVWVRYSKASMRTILSRFSARRMLEHYVYQAYLPAKKQSLQLANNDNAVTLAAWKKRIASQWPGLTLQVVGAPEREIFFGERVQVSVQVALNGLSQQDLVVDCLLGPGNGDDLSPDRCIRLQAADEADEAADTAQFTLDWVPEVCGLTHYRLRVYPHHPLLSHPFETGLMRWV